MTIGVDGDGGVTFADGRYLIRKVAPPLPGFDADGLALPSGDGPEVYEFDRNGRHLRTRDGLTGAVLKTFEYDAAKRLVGVVDAFGKRTRIERDGAGKALAVDRARAASARRWSSMATAGSRASPTRPARRSASPTTSGLHRELPQARGRHDPLRLRHHRPADRATAAPTARSAR